MIRRIGRYEIEAELGQGAFGVVYRAFDPNVNRKVAIKVLRADDDPDVLRRFKAEAGMTGSLIHQNIVTVYEYAEQNGTPYLVMELLEGRTLHELIAKGEPAGVLEKVSVMFQVAEGLHYAHSRGVVHRDMKPANIIVLENGDAKIMDFGIATLINRDATWRTRQEDFAGTIPYMAPEQFRDFKPDKLVDIFAYGVIYYELLAGEHPFFAKDPAAVMYRVTTYNPPPLRERHPEIPAALDEMIQRLIAKERDLRVEKMEDVLLDARPILHELRQARAADLASKIRPLMEAGNFKEAQPLIKGVLDLDPFHAEARAWREQTQARARAETVRARAESLLEEGKARLAGRRFAEAESSFENALNLDKTRDDIRALLERARADLKNSREAARLVADAHWNAQQKMFEAAREKAAQAAAIDPGNAEAARLRDDLARQIREQNAAAAADEIREMMQRGDYPGALEKLESAAGLLDPSLASELRIRIEAERDESERRRRALAFQVGLANARSELAAGNLAAAEKSALDLCRDFPREEAAPELLSEVRERLAAQRRIEAISNLTQAARALINEKRFAQAIESLTEGLRTYPSDVSMARLLEMARALEEAEERSGQIQKVLQEATALRKKEDFDGALRAIEDAVAKFGGAPELVEAKIEVEIDRDHRAYLLARERILNEGRHLIAGARFAEAISLIERALLTYPGDGELAATLEGARASEKERRRATKLKEMLARIAALEAGQKFKEAVAEGERGLEEYADDQELTSAIERARKKLATQEHERALAAATGKIDAAFAAEDWDLAETAIAAAQKEFPDAPALAPYNAAKIAEGRRRKRVRRLEQEVKDGFSRGDLEGAAATLVQANDLAQEPAVEALWGDLNRRLSVGERLADAAGWLEKLSARFPGDARLAPLASAAKEALTRHGERQSLRECLGAVEKLQAAGKLPEALQAAENGLQRHAANPELARVAELLRERLRDQERKKAVADRIASIESAISAENWDAAVASLNDALGQFPDAPELVELRDSFEARRQRAQIDDIAEIVRECLSRGALEEAVRELIASRAGLDSALEWATLWYEIGRSLRKDGLVVREAVAEIESVARLYPDQPELASIAESARAAIAAQRDKFVAECLSRVEALEAKGRAERALEDVESALKIEPGEVKLVLAAERLRASVRTQQAERALAAHIARVDTAIRKEDWDNAASALRAAATEFPGERKLSPLEISIEMGRRRSQIKSLEKSTADSFSKGDLEGVVQQLAATRAALSQDPAWQVIWRELERRKSYEAGLSLAEKAFNSREFGRAQDILKWLLPEAPDERANDLLRAVMNEGRKQKAAAEKRRQDLGPSMGGPGMGGPGLGEPRPETAPELSGKTDGTHTGSDTWNTFRKWWRR